MQTLSIKCFAVWVFLFPTRMWLILRCLPHLSLWFVLPSSPMMSTTYCRCTSLYVPLSRHAQGTKLKLLSKWGDILIYFHKTLLEKDEAMQINKAWWVIVIQAKNQHILDLEHFRRNWPCQDWRSAEHRYIDVSWCIRHDSSLMNESAKQNGFNPLIESYWFLLGY